MLPATLVGRNLDDCAVVFTIVPIPLIHSLEHAYIRHLLQWMTFWAFLWALPRVIFFLTEAPIKVYLKVWVLHFSLLDLLISLVPKGLTVSAFSVPVCPGFHQAHPFLRGHQTDVSEELLLCLRLCLRLDHGVLLLAQVRYLYLRLVAHVDDESLQILHLFAQDFLTIMIIFHYCAVRSLLQALATRAAKLVDRMEDLRVTVLHPMLLFQLCRRLIVCIVTAESAPVETLLMMEL